MKNYNFCTSQNNHNRAYMNILAFGIHNMIGRVISNNVRLISLAPAALQAVILMHAGVSNLMIFENI